MTIAVRRFLDSDTEAIERLNRRLAAGQVEHRLYREDLSVNPEADLAISPINDALFVATDGVEIRGGAWLREQYFWVDGARHRVGWMKYPVSESLVDRQFAGVPASMILQFLRQQPRLMALGMGGHDAPFARLLAGIRWTSSTIPFFFRISRPFRVLRGLAYLRRRWWLRTAMDLAAWSGIGWLAHRIFQARARAVDGASELEVSVEPKFSPWADPIWEATRDAYRALAVRDARTLDFSYPEQFPGLDRLRITRGARDIGLACAQVLPANDSTSSYFGDLRVGIVTDALARPEDAGAVMALAVRHLEALGVDLVITYLSHSAWITAAKGLAFLEGPSTFAFYRSPGAEKLLLDASLSSCYLTRSDGDGPKW